MMPHNFFGIQGSYYAYRWQCIHCQYIAITTEDRRPSPDMKVVLNASTSRAQILTCDEYKVLQVQDA
jgi:hypothetical protein